MHEEQLSNLNNHLEQYQCPFKPARVAYSGVEDEWAYVENMKDPYGRQLEDFEAQMVDKLDPITSLAALSMGYENLPNFMFRCLTYLTVIYLCFSILQSFERPDFLNLTLGCISIFQLSNREKLRKSSFRNLVLGLILSFFYDLYWISLEWVDFEASTDEDGTNPEKSLK
jgi:hypothetical protein